MNRRLLSRRSFLAGCAALIGALTSFAPSHAASSGGDHSGTVQECPPSSAGQVAEDEGWFCYKPDGPARQPPGSG
jgi:hypothetical protein